MKIGLLDCHDPRYNKIAKICNKSKIRYCKIHCYDFLEYKFDNINPYGPTWGRVFGIESNLKKYDWILYLDTDTFLVDYEIKIEDNVDDNYNIIIGRMPDFHTGVLNHISTSAILIKNCSWSFDFIDLWKKQKKFIYEPYHAKKEHCHLSTLGEGGLFFEQSAFHYLYDNFEDVRKNIFVHNDVWFNDRESTFNDKSFLIHFARSPKEKRIKNFLNKRLCL